MEFDPIEMQSVRSNIQNFEDDVERDKYLAQSAMQRAAEAEKEATQQREIDQQIYSNLESGQLDPVQQEQQEQQEQEKQQFDANANVPVDILRAFPNAAVNITEDILNFGTADDPRFTLDTIEPQMKTPWGQMTSNIIQSVGPLLAMAALTKRGRSLIRRSKFGGRVPAGGVLDKLGTGSAAIGAESLWTVATRQSLEPNLSESLKEWFPGQTSWIPNWLATRPADSPDTKRLKAVGENIALGGLFPLISGVRRLLKGDPTIMQRVKPTDEAGAALKKNIERTEVKGYSDDPVTEAVLVDEALNAKDGAEMAEVRFARDPEGTQPDPYVNSPMYDAYERPTKAVNSTAAVESLVNDYEIKNNIGTVNGRSTPILTNAATDSLSEGDIVRRALIDKVEGLVDKIVKSGFVVEMPGQLKNPSNKELVANLDNLADAFLEMPVNKMYDILEQVGAFETIDVAGQAQRRMKTIYAAAALRANRKLLKDVTPNRMRASAKVQTELAGEISDAAEAIGLGADSLAFNTLQDTIGNKLAVLTYEYALTSSINGYLLNMSKVAQGGKVTADDVAKALKQFKINAKEQVQEVRKLFNDLAVIRDSNPKLADALANVFDITQGSVRDVDTMRKILSEAVSGRSNLARSFVNIGNKAPALMVEAVTGLFYNFKLSSLYTPVKAWTSNMASLFMKPMNQMAGHFLSGQAHEANRVWIAYFGGFQDTIRMSSWYAGTRFRKVMQSSPEQLLRKDYAEAYKQRQAWINATEQYADATGDLTMQMKVNAVKAIDGFNNLPWVRYSMNMMESGDGFVGAFLAQVDKRMKMLDDIYNANKKITAADIETVNRAMQKDAKKVIAGAFDESGELKDGVLKYARGEIAMNLDTPITQAVGQFTSQFPIMKTFVMFPRTAYNSLAFTSKHTPFSQELRKALTLTDPKEIADYLQTKGIPFSETNWMRFKAETFGRVAVGTSIMTYAWGMWASGNMTGNGVYDRGVDRLTTNMAGRPKRSWRIAPGTPWISYDGIEPISSLLAATVDIPDNYDSLGDTGFNNIANSLAFIFAENVTNKSFMDGLQPLLDVANGNQYAVGRYAANILSVPILGQLGNLINPGVRQAESDMLSQIRKKWSILDAAGIGEPLPFKYDIVEGGKINAEDFIFKGILPFKMSPSGGPEKDLLIESEFDVQPSFTSSLGGVPYDQTQISKLQYIIGEKGLFKKRLARIAKLPWVKAELESIREARRKGADKDKLDLSKSRLHVEIRSALRQSVNEAKFLLGKQDASIGAAENLKYQTERAQKLSDYDKIQRLLDLPK